MASHINDEIVEKIRSHPKLVVAEDYELCVQRERSATVIHRNGELAERNSDDNFWISLRVLHRRRPGCAVARAPGRDALSRLVDEAFESAERASVDPWFRFPIWRRPKGLLPEALEVRALDALPEPLFPRIAIPPTALEELYEIDLVDTVLVRRTEKLELRHSRRNERLRFSVVFPTVGGFHQIREERAASRPLDAKENWLEGLLHRALHYSEAPLFNGEETADVVFAPVIGSALLSRMAEWFLGDRAQAKQSPLASYLDRQLFSEAISIVDDGSLAESSVAMPFDLEGTLTQPTTLVEQGRLKQFLYDTYHGTRENRVSTGNFFRRGSASEPHVENGATYFAPSARKSEDLVASITDGYVLETLDGLDTLGGAYGSQLLLTASGWKVQNGQRVAPIRSILCRVDLMNVWQDALAVGDDLQFFDRYGAPSILFRKIPLGI